MLAAFLSIGTLAALGDRPTMHEIVSWIDSETLLLIFSMMAMVAVLMETGVFEYVAVCAFQVIEILELSTVPFVRFECLQFSGGRIWKLIATLCCISALISVFLDNVTTILLMTPIAVKIFECLGLNPVPVLPFIILNVNIAGLATLIGHPPNLLITNNEFVARHDVSFLTYTTHMSIGVLLALVQANIHLRIQCRSIEQKLRNNCSQQSVASEWQEALRTLRSSRKTTSADFERMEDILIAKITDLQRTDINTETEQVFQSTLRRLKSAVRVPIRWCRGDKFNLIIQLISFAKYPIRDEALLKKSGFVLVLVVALFFIESIPSIQRMSLGWCAFTGVVLLLLISG